MARYSGPSCKLCRREGVKLYLKGDRCYSDKCALARRPYAPGQHGHNKKKLTNYGVQLREKQKAKRIYGVLESQFRKYYEEADRLKGITGENLLRLLELRLDNVIFRLGFASSRAEARQLVRHGHFTVNGKKVNIPSYQVRVNDEIAVREKSKSSEKIKALMQVETNVPKWLTVDKENMVGRVVSLPQREDIDIPVNETLIVELYSK
ncbi:30S ribosomal protein S4 [Caloramator proteoclasticus]|uniref:Small ribosomal subunit protein uS4 n=1 Tax=Caloramator proteoclasticus DSM 10124 TaxID=1121262 RepID=A0A1M4VRP4_9CLOT|nr:30S ribosomal protein S4 [Caloramator proteoclasticus]SHE71781.1 small subunit ribosomal protein S4 [Caloramator proteoclasticus DSM 10124]